MDAIKLWARNGDAVRHAVESMWRVAPAITQGIRGYSRPVKYGTLEHIFSAAGSFAHSGSIAEPTADPGASA